MGIGSNWAIELEEERYREAKEEWIQERLGEDANEYSIGWDELSDAYDELSSGDPYYDDDWYVKGKTRLEIFDETVQIVREVLSTKFSQRTSKGVLVMLHGHIVAAIEAYLSSTFIDITLSSEEYIRTLVENDPEFAKRKFTLTEIYTKKEALYDDVRKYLRDLIFHKIEKVGPMYKSVLSVDFGDVKWLFEAVSLRHHCVHRAGYDKDGNEVQLSIPKIDSMLKQSIQLVTSIESATSKLSNTGK